MMTREITCELIRECLEPGSTGLSEADRLAAVNWSEVYAEMRAQSIEALAQSWLLQHELPQSKLPESELSESKLPESELSESELSESELSENELPESELRMKWLRGTFLEQTKWIRVMNGQDQLLKLLEREKIECVIIKGAAAAVAYPKPALRRAGDVDFLVRQDDFEKAAKVLEENGYVLEQGKNEEHHHYCYEKDGVSFELHRRLGIVREENRELIKAFEDGITRREFREIETFRFPILPVELNGLSLMFHINQHIRTGLGLRQILDWMLYLRENRNLEQLMPWFRETGMEKLAMTVTALCQVYFGLEAGIEEPEQYPCAELMDYVWEKGNFGYKSGEEGKIASIFMILTNPMQFLRRLQKGGLLRWKAATRHGFLRPFAWVYQIGFILHELAVNRITPRKMLEQKKAGVEQRELIRSLGLEVDREI